MGESEDKTMKTCVYCGCENHDDANFCKACGKPFEVVRETPEVQEEIQAEIPQYGEMLRSMPSLGEEEAKETLEEMNAGGLTLPGRLMLFKLTQSLKASLPISLTCPGNSITRRDLHPSKAKQPISLSS